MIRKTWIRVALGAVLLIVALSGWASRIYLAQQKRHEDARIATFSDTVTDYVRFEVEGDQLLVLVMDPHQDIVWLPDAAGAWVATAAIEADNTLSIWREGKHLMDVWTPADLD